MATCCVDFRPHLFGPFTRESLEAVGEAAHEPLDRWGAGDTGGEASDRGVD